MDVHRPMETLEESIEVEAPVTATYNQWTQFEDFPRFMEEVESVTQLDDKRVHWVAEVAGKRKEWDAEITRQAPDREIDWVGLGDADNRGRIVFEALDGDTSEVTMMLDYDPEGIVEEIGDALGLVKRRVRGDMEGSRSSSRRGAGRRAVGGARSGRTSGRLNRRCGRPFRRQQARDIACCRARTTRRGTQAQSRKAS